MRAAKLILSCILEIISFSSPSVLEVEFWCILKDDRRGVDVMTLPITGESRPCATVEETTQSRST